MRHQRMARLRWWRNWSKQGERSMSKMSGVPPLSTGHQCLATWRSSLLFSPLEQTKHLRIYMAEHLMILQTTKTARMPLSKNVLPPPPDIKWFPSSKSIGRIPVVSTQCCYLLVNFPAIASYESHLGFWNWALFAQKLGHFCPRNYTGFFLTKVRSLCFILIKNMKM